MKATELRIGNFLRSNNPKYRPDILGETLVVSGINSEKDNSHFISGTSVSVYRKSNKHKDTFGQYLEFLEPIPLTEEWLLKFGFIKREDYYFLRGLKIRFWEGVNIEYKDISIYEVVGFSVNELQNLYFALTLKELASDSAQL